MQKLHPFQTGANPVEAFQAWLAQDMAAHPESLQPLPPDVVAVMRALLAEQPPVDLAAPIIGEVPL